MHLPECNGFNAMYTCIDRLLGLIRLTLCTNGAGEMSAAAVAKLFFNAVVRKFGLPDDIAHEGTLSLWQICGESCGPQWALKHYSHQPIIRKWMSKPNGPIGPWNWLSVVCCPSLVRRMTKGVSFMVWLSLQSILPCWKVGGPLLLSLRMGNHLARL